MERREQGTHIEKRREKKRKKRRKTRKREEKERDVRPRFSNKKLSLKSSARHKTENRTKTWEANLYLAFLYEEGRFRSFHIAVKCLVITLVSCKKSSIAGRGFVFPLSFVCFYLSVYSCVCRGVGLCVGLCVHPCV